jgi:hypothetical protein
MEEAAVVLDQQAGRGQRADLGGRSHASGRGLATYDDRVPHVERRAWAAPRGEHFFQYLRTLQERAPRAAAVECLRQALRQVVAWCRELDPGSRIGLNVLLTNGSEMVGSRLRRSLCYADRPGPPHS